MRSTFLPLVQDTDTGIFSVSQELPYTADGTNLYVKNPRRIYVDQSQTEQETIIQTLDNLNVVRETSTISVFFVVEAKTVAGYDDAVTNLKLLTQAQEIKSQGYTNRQVTVTTSYEDNLLVTELTYTFSRIL